MFPITFTEEMMRNIKHLCVFVCVCVVNRTAT